MMDLGLWVVVETVKAGSREFEKHRDKGTDKPLCIEPHPDWERRFCFFVTVALCDDYSP